MLDIFTAWQQEAEKLRSEEITKEEYDAWRFNLDILFFHSLHHWNSFVVNSHGRQSVQSLILYMFSNLRNLLLSLACQMLPLRQVFSSFRLLVESGSFIHTSNHKIIISYHKQDTSYLGMFESDVRMVKLSDLAVAISILSKGSR